MKRIHRLMVTSAAYRRQTGSGLSGSAENETAAGGTEAVRPADRDPENRLLWRMNPGRMEAEVVRDSLLFTAGLLDPKMGGQELENPEALKTFRRSLYYSVFPEVGGKSPIGELFDGPDAMECYRRSRTIVPQQALALTNSDLVHTVAAAIVAAEAVKMPGEAVGTPDNGAADPGAFVTAVFERILSRPPTEAELKLCREGLEAQLQLMQSRNLPDAARRARESLVRVLLNHNDFVGIR